MALPDEGHHVVHQVARRIALTSRYANITDDPEAEYDKYFALVNTRLQAVLSAECLVPSAELKCKDGRASDAPSTKHQAPSTKHLTIPGWPFSRRAAIDGQTGGGAF